MIKLAVFDFDGVFTNGDIFLNGNFVKKFNVKDGMGLKILINNNVKIAVISGFKENDSQINILNHLNVYKIYFGVENKL